jgi:murein DD-endopeptidase MepM/ murein hydrolase activator NlpD
LRVRDGSVYTPSVPFPFRRVRSSWFVAAAIFLSAFLAVTVLVGRLPTPVAALTSAAREVESTARPATGDLVAGPSPAMPTAHPRPYLATPPPRPVPTPTPKAVPTPAPPAELSGYEWPLRGRLTLGFQHTGWGTRLVDGKRFHDGLDIATFCGDTIRAAHDGVVLAAGRRFDDHVGWIGDLAPYYDRLDRKKAWGSLPIVVVIDDGNGYRSIYAHFEKVTVKKGQRVSAGQRIGYEGATGRASGCHLHYGLFSPYETERFGLHPDTAKRMRLPRAEVARIDPLLVLPYRKGISPASAPGAPAPATVTAP